MCVWCGHVIGTTCDWRGSGRGEGEGGEEDEARKRKEGGCCVVAGRAHLDWQRTAASSLSPFQSGISRVSTCYWANQRGILWGLQIGRAWIA